MKSPSCFGNLACVSNHQEGLQQTRVYSVHVVYLLIVRFLRNNRAVLYASGWFVHRSHPSKLGRKPVSSPIRGRKEQTQYTYSMLVRSASWPKTADPMPAIPKANPKKSPDISPTLPGTNSWA